MFCYHISLIRHTRPGESQRRTGENRPPIAQVDSARAGVARRIVLTMRQSQARSGPCWMTRLSALMLMSHPGSRVPSASMMGLAGWLDVL